MEKILTKKSSDPELEIKFDRLYNRIPTAASDEEEDSESEYILEDSKSSDNSFSNSHNNEEF
jgi:hypothetical protein